MANMTRAQFRKSLTKGLNGHFGMEYARHKPQWTEIFDQYTSRQAYEEDQQLVGLGAAVETAEGSMIMLDSGQEGWTARYTMIKIGLGFAITDEAIKDNQYGNIVEKFSKALARSFNHTKETRHANILNRSTNSSYAGGDGVELCGVHTLSDGSTLQNELSTAADLDEASLEDLCILIEGATDDRGLQIALKPKKLIIHRENHFVAERILNSTLRPGTALNDINVINANSVIPGGYCVNQYLTDSSKWWLKTDAPDGLKHFKREGMTQRVIDDDRTQSYTYVASERYAPGWTDFRGLYGNG